MPFTTRLIAALFCRTSFGLVGCGLVVGSLHAWLLGSSWLEHRWPASRSGDRVIAIVIIDTIPVTRGETRLFDGIATLEAPKRTATPLHVRLVSRASGFKPHVGDRWRLLLSLRPPRAKVNPGTQDTERILFHDGIHALGTVLDSSVNRRIDSGHRPLDALRERIAHHIDSQVADRDAAALISALAVGVTGSMSREQWRVFNVTGTTHLVAISGLHVTLFAVVAFAAARTLWSLLLYRFVPWQRENFAALVGFLAAAGYAALAGLSVPTQRTLIMLGAWLFTRSIARASTPFHSFVLALLGVLIFDPFAPLTPGFWLSFIAMAAIILLTSTRFAQRPMLIEALAVQTVVTIALVPVTLAAFGSVSLIGPVVNLAAIPAMSWIFVPTILLSVLLAPVLPGASDRVLDLAAWMHDIAWPWLAAAADLPWALVHASPPVWWYVLASIGVLLSLMPWPLRLRLAAVVWVFPLALAVDSHPDEGVAEITALDVGKQTSVVVQTAKHVLIYEVGEGYGTDGRIAESILVPFLRSRGVRRIDVLVLNRLTAVNGPGVTALLAEMPVNQTWVGGAAGMDLPGARRCPSDEAWEWDGVRFAGSSAGACTIRVQSGGARGLLGPSATEFVRADGAHWTVVPGRREANGREKPAVLHSREAGVTLLATGDLGAIRFRLDPVAGLQGPAAARLDSHAPWRLPSTAQAALRYDAGHPKVPWLDGKNVGNRAGRRTPDVADHSVFHRRRSDHPRTALDSSGQTRPAPRADAESVAAHRIQSGE